MKKVVAFETVDGMAFPTRHDAERHLKNKLTVQASHLADSALRVPTSTVEMTQWILDKLDSLVALKQWRDDLVLENEEPEE